MKLITAIIKPFKLDEVRQAVDDSIAAQVTEALCNVARTGKFGDGRVWAGARFAAFIPHKNAILHAVAQQLAHPFCYGSGLL